MRQAARWAVLLLALGAALPARAADIRAFPLPGDGPWDYVTYDAAHRRVFIGRYDGVQVVDADTGRLAARIGARTGDHGAALAPDQQRVFTSDAVARQLGVYDLGTLAAQRPVKLGGEPDGMVYDPASHRLLALLPRSHEIVAVDARTLHVAGRLDVGGEPEAGVADGRGGVFVTLRDTGVVVGLDAASLRVRARWPAGCARPIPIAMDPPARRLFVGCRDARLVVLDAVDGRVIATLPTAPGTDGLGFDPARRLIVVSNGSGSLSLSRAQGPDVYQSLPALPMPPGARTLALDGASGRAFTVTADIASVQPPTKARPFPRLIPKVGTFRLLVVTLPP